MAKRTHSKIFFDETHGHTAWNKASDNASRALPVVDKEVEGSDEELGGCKKKNAKGCSKELKYNQHCPTCRFRATRRKDAFHVLLEKDRQCNPTYDVGMLNEGKLRAGNSEKRLNAYFCPQQLPAWNEEFGGQLQSIENT